MDYVEILGYVAMILVACSFLLKDVIKLRVVNSLGCA
ncbi:TPA: lactate dehydrogenase, partial [Mannheimia haemolytica]|nr:lactate dehydrogenase [Mannheimia haemolytica]